MSRRSGIGKTALIFEKSTLSRIRFSRFFEHVVSLSSRDRVSSFPGPDERTLSQPGHLLKLDDGSDFGELGLDGLGLFLGHAFLERLGGAVDEVLGFLEAEAGDFADDLDDVDLLVADGLQDDGELGLLLGRAWPRRRGRRRRP